MKLNKNNILSVSQQCTRAKENLTISSQKYIYRQGSISEYEPSMFLEGMDSYYVEKAIAIDENS